MERKIVTYQRTNDTLENVIKKIGTPIVEHNRMNGWEDDNIDDIFHAILNEYRLNDNEAKVFLQKIKDFVNR